MAETLVGGSLVPGRSTFHPPGTARRWRGTVGQTESLGTGQGRGAGTPAATRRAGWSWLRLRVLWRGRSDIECDTARDHLQHGYGDGSYNGSVSIRRADARMVGHSAAGNGVAATGSCHKSTPGTTFQVLEGRGVQRKADPRRTGGQPGSHCWSCKKEWSSPCRHAPGHLLSSSPGFQGRSRRSLAGEVVIFGSSIPWAYERLPRKFVIAAFTPFTGRLEVMALSYHSRPEMTAMLFFLLFIKYAALVSSASEGAVTRPSGDPFKML